MYIVAVIYMYVCVPVGNNGVPANAEREGGAGTSGVQQGAGIQTSRYTCIPY